MGRPPGWMRELTGRDPLRSPGRPGIAARDDRVVFWLAIADGFSSSEAAELAGVSEPVGSRWFRQGGGMPNVCLAPLSGRYLSFAERERLRCCGPQDSGRAGSSRIIGGDPRVGLVTRAAPPRRYSRRHARPPRVEAQWKKAMAAQ